MKHRQSREKEVKEEAVRPETFRGSAPSSPSRLISRATHGLVGLEGFLSGSAASPSTQESGTSVVITKEADLTVIYSGWENS